VPIFIGRGASLRYTLSPPKLADFGLRRGGSFSELGLRVQVDGGRERDWTACVGIAAIGGQTHAPGTVETTPLVAAVVRTTDQPNPPTAGPR